MLTVLGSVNYWLTLEIENAACVVIGTGIGGA